MSNISRAHAISLVSFDTATLDPVTWKVLTASLQEACFLIRYTNYSANNVYISYDLGTTTHDVVLPNSYIEIYFQNNASYSEKTNNIAKATPIYVRGTAGAGALTLSGYTYVE